MAGNPLLLQIKKHVIARTGGATKQPLRVQVGDVVASLLTSTHSPLAMT
jgi:hypothetical protein